MGNHSDSMEEKTPQERFRQEDEMARGPVSRGASNKDAPMYQQSSAAPSTSGQQNQDYGKMIETRPTGTAKGTGMQTDRELGSVGGGTLPEGQRGTGEARGGMATSNSTAAAGGTSGGGLIGQGLTRDRGSMSDEEMDTSTNNSLEQENQAQGQVPTRLADLQSASSRSDEHT